MVTVVVTGHSSRRSTPPRWTPTGNGLQRGQFCWPPLGKTVDRQRGSYMAATGQDLMAADTPGIAPEIKRAGRASHTAHHQRR